MGSSDSKPTDPAKKEPPFSQNDNLLDLLNVANIQKGDDYKEVVEKLNKKLNTAFIGQKEKTDPNATALLNLKYEKLILKLRKRKDQYDSEATFISTIRQIYTDQKEKLRILENEKTVQVANLKLDITALNVEIDNLKQKLQRQELTYGAKLQEGEFLCSSQRHSISELKRKEQTLDGLQSTNFNLAFKLADSKRHVDALTTKELTFRKSHEEQYNSLLIKCTAKESAIVNLRAANSKFDIEHAKFKQEIMFLKTQNHECTTRQHNEVVKYNDVFEKHNLEEAKNRDLRNELNAIKNSLINNVKLTSLQQRGVFIEIKKSLQGMVSDWQYLLPNLNQMTIPTSFEGSHEMEKLKALLNRNQENLDNIIAFQSRFDSLVISKQPLTSMEKIPNFLSGVELPYSFLHVKFLPLFRITFTTIGEEPPNHNNPRPLLDSSHRPNKTDNKNKRGAFNNYNKTRQFTSRFQNNKDGCEVDPSELTRRNVNTYLRGARGSSNNKQQRQQRKQNVKPVKDEQDGSDCESTSGVILTVLSIPSTSGITKKMENLGSTTPNGQCFICCEALFQTPMLPLRQLEYCVHKYHESCIDKWYESNTECPECSKEDDSDD